MKNINIPQITENQENDPSHHTYSLQKAVGTMNFLVSELVEEARFLIDIEHGLIIVVLELVQLYSFRAKRTVR